MNHHMLKRLVHRLGCVSIIVAASSAWAIDAGQPEGFGKATTGGAGGQVVLITDPVAGREQLKTALCDSYAGGVCTDTTSRIIQIATAIDYTGSEGSASDIGCYTIVCSAPYKSEALIVGSSGLPQCNGKETSMIAYDVAGTKPLQVGSNKTIIGLTPDAAIKGKGWRVINAHNVVIRNLTFSDINQGIVFGGDAISLENADRVWIDHNRFHNIGRQMIVHHFGPVTNTTISWNDFDGSNIYSPSCNGKHYWNLLLISEQQTVTIAHNWFHEFSGRAPKILGSNAIVQMVNNYFQDGSWHALDATGASKILVEGNYFDQVNLPIIPDTGSIFGTLGTPNAAAQVQCNAALLRDCQANLANPLPTTNGFRQDSTVLDAIRVLDHSSIVKPGAVADVPALVRENAGPGHI